MELPATLRTLFDRPTEQWVTVAVAVLLEVLIARRAFALPFILAEVFCWLVVLVVTIVAAHPIVIGRGTTTMSAVALTGAVTALAFAIAQLTTIVRLWSVIQLVTAPVLGTLIGVGVYYLARFLARKPVVVVS